MYNIFYTYSRYIIFKKCWKLEPSERLTFEDLVAMLDIRLQEIAGYLEMDMALVPNEGEDKKAVMNTNFSVTNSNPIN